LRSIPRTVGEAKTNLEKNSVSAFALAAIEKLKDVGNRLKKVVAELKPLIIADTSAQLELATEI